MAKNTLNKRPAMPDAELNNDLNRRRVQTIFADLDLALAFTKLAETSGNAATQKRNWGHARDAFPPSAITSYLYVR